MKQQHLPMFSKWRCITHDCGSYNFNNLWRHEMNSCQIVSETTIGVIKPKTYGGINGDLSRHNYPEWQQLQILKQSQSAIKNKWEHFLEKKRLEIIRVRKNTLANRIKGVFKD